MKRSLVIFSSLVLAATMVLLSSCDSGSNSTATDTNPPKDTGALDTIAMVIVPVFSPSGGTFSAAQTVTISSATSGATIYYTVDGSTPTTASAKYTSPVNVSASKTLKAIAVKSGLTTSSVSSAVYAISSNTSSSTIQWNTSITYGSVSDAAGQSYKTVVIGTQTWMAENLNFKVDSSWCYANSTDSCAKYGRLYQWAAVMGLDASYNTKLWSGALPRQGVCPSGWHLPSDAEWSTFETYVGGEATAGRKLKSMSGWSWSGVPSNGTDAYGFRALPAGDRNYDGRFGRAGGGADFWASSESDTDLAWDRHLLSSGSSSDGLDRFDYSKINGHSVRCIKD